MKQIHADNNDIFTLVHFGQPSILKVSVYMTNVKSENRHLSFGNWPDVGLFFPREAKLIKKTFPKAAIENQVYATAGRSNPFGLLIKYLKSLVLVDAGYLERADAEKRQESTVS